MSHPARSWPSWKMRIVSLTLAAMLLPFVFHGARQAWMESGTRVEDWLPAGFEETQRLTEFFQRFGSDELLMIGWEGAKLGDQRVAELRDRLLLPDPEDPQRRIFFGAGYTGDSVFESMRNRPLDLSSRQAKARMRGWILGEDNATAVIALVSDAGMADRHAAVRYARRVAADVTGLPSEKLHLAGPTIESVAIDEASQSSLLRLNGYSFAVCTLLLILCLRNLWQAVFVFGIALYLEQGAMALIFYSGGRLDSILLLTANLTLVLSVSAGIHMLGYYRNALRDPSDSWPVWTALRTAFKPTVLAAITTAIGFGSLTISNVLPVYYFGFYTAIAAPIAALLTLWYVAVYIPATKRPVTKRSSQTSPAEQHSLTPFDDTESTSRLERYWLKHWAIVLPMFCGIIALGGWGATHLQTSAGIHDLLPTDAKLLEDYAWLEKEIGPLVPIEIVVEIPVDQDRLLTDELRLLATLQRALAEHESVGSLISVLNFSRSVPPVKERYSISSIAAREGFESSLNDSLELYESIRLMRREPGKRLWRMTARIAGSEPHSYPELMAGIRSITDQTLQQSEFSEVEFAISGGVPLAVKTQQRLLKDLAISYFTALLLIGTTLALVLRNLLAGVIALVPNVIPAMVVFGWMGAMGWQAEIGGVMTASAVLGIAVDDSLHLIIAFREWFGRGFSRQRSAVLAVKTCGPAVVQTTLVCGLGMLVFGLSPFVPIQRFAWLMFSLLGVALFADLLLLPAILYSPIGKAFLNHAASVTDESETVADVAPSDAS